MQQVIRLPARNQRIRPQLRGLGVTSQQTTQASSTVAAAGASAIALDAGAGAVAGPIGAAAGALVGVLVGILTATNNTASHIGTWDSQLVSTINSLSNTAQGLGRQFAWNENSHGLVQMIEAALACGVYMAWDTSLISNYAVCAHWATTFGQAVQNVTQSICTNAVGAKCTVSIPLSPGAGGYPPFNFTFTNPGIGVGPDAISANIIMGSTGLMGAMLKALGGQAPQNIASNETNATAKKIFALMIDYWAAQYAPAAAVPATPAPVIAPAVTAAATAANSAAAAGQNPQTAATVAATAVTAPVAAQPPPVTGTTATGTPVVAPSDTGALVASLVAQGTSATQALQAATASLEANGINSQTPESQAALQSSVSAPAISQTDWILLGAGGIALFAILMMEMRRK